jgi:proline racemase
MDADGYPDMCGHATIGVATTLVELGLVATGSFTLDTPAGAVDVHVDVRDGRAVEVAFDNRPAYFADRVTVELSGRPVAVDVAWGGQWYAFAPSAAIGLAVEPEAIDALVDAAADLRAALAGALDPVDPATGADRVVGNVVWCDAPRGEADARNVAISAVGSFDRSPCGTATSARLAVLHREGRLGVGDRFVNESLLGTTYTGTVFATTTVGDVPAIVPRIAGRAWLTGTQTLWVDPTDPLRDGYLVGNR